MAAWSFENANVVLKSVYNDALIGAIGYISILDIKRMHGTGGFGNYIFGETGSYYHMDFYTPKALQKYGY